MALDLVPNRLLSFPTMPSLWNDEDDWLTAPTTMNGLTVSEDDTKVYVEAAVPGIDPKSIEMTFQDGYLWVRGESKEEEKDAKRKYYRKAAKSFSYRVAIPGDVDEHQEPEASYKHGIMTVAFTKAQKAQPKKIQLKEIKG